MTASPVSPPQARLQMVPYTRDLEPLVCELNQRLKKRGIKASLPEVCEQPYPRFAARDIFQESFLLVDEVAARGGYAVKCQSFKLPAGNLEEVTELQLPVSEGLADPQFAAVGVRLIRHALQRHPLLFALGIGSRHENLARLLVAMHWSICVVPFYFKVINPLQFIANISYLRRNHSTAVALDWLQHTGMSSALFQTLQWRAAIHDVGISASIVTEFGAWADELWEEAQSDYTFCGLRNEANLNLLYPRSDPRFIRLRVDRQGRAIGWAVILSTQMFAHRQFGNMRVGSLIDGLSRRSDASAVVKSAVHELELRRPDIIVSNQANSAWRSALLKAGFVRGPSNYLFAASKDLTAHLQPLDATTRGFHLNRGDGDGPINL